jgi:hypothetical protein
MKQYYIVEFGECVSTAKFLGYYASLDHAREDAFFEMDDGDLLVGYALDVDPEYTDIYGFDTVDTEIASEDEKVYLYRTDGTIEDVPKDLYYWSDDDYTIFYFANGQAWN